MVVKRAFGKPRPPFFTGSLSPVPKLLPGVNRVPIALIPNNTKLNNFAKQMAAKVSRGNKPVSLQSQRDSQAERRRAFIERAKKNVVLPGSLKNGRKKP